jgi:hypothetical protein
MTRLTMLANYHSVYIIFIKSINLFVEELTISTHIIGATLLFYGSASYNMAVFHSVVVQILITKLYFSTINAKYLQMPSKDKWNPAVK